MKSMNIKRIKPDNGVQTLGVLKVFESEKAVYSCKTLELAWKNNAGQISCIPAGSYTVVKRISPSLGLCFHITNVAGRRYILIHQGNYHTQIHGCVLVGQNHTDINKDGHKDVTSSVATLKYLLTLMPDKFTLTIS